MNRQHVFHVFRKDGLEILRDRRTIFVNVVLPILLYPLLLLFLLQVMQLIKKQKVEVPGVILVDVPEAIASSLRSDSEEAPAPPRAKGSTNAGGPFGEEHVASVHLITADAALSRELTARVTELTRLSAMLHTTPAPRADDPLRSRWRDASGAMLYDLRQRGAVAALVRQPDQGQQQRFVVIQDEASRRWDAVDAMLEQAIDSYRDGMIKTRLEHAHLPESTIHPLELTQLPMASIAETIRTRLGGMLPLLLVVLSASGAFFPALDLICGERERGTLETLLSWPVRRRDLFLGKLMVACCAAALSVLLHITSLGVSLAIGGHQLHNMGGDLGGLYSVGLGTLALCAMVIMPLIITLAAIALAVTGLASTAKEAQNYLTPFTLVVVVGAMVGLIPGTRPGFILDLLPVVGPVLTLKESMQSEHLPWFDLLVTCAASLSLAWVVVGWSTRLLEDERFRYPGLVRAGWGRFRRWGKRPPIPGGLEVMGVFALAVGGFTMLSGYADVNDLAIVCVPLIAFAALPALVHCYLGAYDPRQTLSLRRCSTRSTLLAVVMIPCAVTLSIIVMLVQGHLFAGPPAAEQKIKEITDQLHALGGLPLMLLVMGVLPGICEELLFRGTILSGLRRGIGTTGGVLVSAFLFAALHGDPERFLPQCLLGIVLAILTLRSGSLFPAMIVHAGHNMTVLVVDEYGAAIQQWSLVRPLVAFIERVPAVVPVLILVGVCGAVVCLLAVRPRPDTAATIPAAPSAPPPGAT